MWKNKKNPVPNWIIKVFKEGKEDERLCYLVDIFFFSLVTIVWAIKLLANLIPFVYLTICSLVILALLIGLFYWLFCKVELLKSLREQSKSSKTKEKLKASEPKKLR